MASPEVALRRIVTLKRDVLQAKIDGLGQQQALLTQRIDQLQSQGDGLSLGNVSLGGFQLAAMAGESARGTIQKLQRGRAKIMDQRRDLVRERVALDLADRKLADAQKAEQRLQESRADLKG